MTTDGQSRHPNILFILADQWRAQATGYAGDVNVHTPNLDRLASESVNMTRAVSGCPVCCPMRASLMTGQFPLTHGVFLNDVPLSTDAFTIGDALQGAGYDTGYIGKWHLDGSGSRSSFIPKERRQGFEFWRVLECTHNYNNSAYYGEDNVRRVWNGYDAIAQTREAIGYLSERPKDRPFCLFLAWGPPHAPYNTAPEEYREMYAEREIVLRANVPAEDAEKATEELRGYYAHMAALDDSLGELLAALDQFELADDTIVVFSSDHGDMIRSQGSVKKQQPWDESIRVPLLIRPCGEAREGREIDMPINTPDIMPTLLGMCGLPIPESVEGTDYSRVLSGEAPADNEAVLIQCPSPFGQWHRDLGGREYRGVRTRRYTYARDLEGPWLLFDNETDPYQLDNLCDRSEFSSLQEELEGHLKRLLAERGDAFLPGGDYIRKWGYVVNERGTVRYTN